MKQFKNFPPFIILFVMIFVVSFSGCKKDDDDSANPVTPLGPTLKTTVTGRVTDTDNNVVIGATVKMGSLITTSDSRGIFIFMNKDVPKERFVLKVSKQGYFESIKGKRTQTGGVNYIDVVIEELPTAINVNGVTGGVVNIPGGAKITFPANAFVDANGNAYTGMVKVYARHFNPAADGFEANVPGGDLLAINANGQPRSLYSLGMIEALLKDNSGVNEIKLADGIAAQLRIPIDASQMSQALATIPMWYLNETTGIWKEEGEAIKNGNFYEGSVAHFSTWNCDYQGERTEIRGKVVDCQGNPIGNVIVTISGFLNIMTDNAGYYTAMVPAGFVIEAQVLISYNSFLSSNSNIESMTTIAGQVNVFPNLIIPCATILKGDIYVCGTQQRNPALIYISWNGGNRVYSASDGTYSIYAPSNIDIEILANYLNYSGNTSILSGSQGTITDVTEIELCNPMAQPINKFTVNDGLGSSTEYEMIIDEVITAVYEDLDGDGIIEYSFQYNGVAQPGNFQVTITMNFSTILGDTIAELRTLFTPQNYFIIDMNNTATSYHFDSADNPAQNQTSNYLVVLNQGMPGGLITGTYEFDVMGGEFITSGVFSIPLPF